MVPDISKVCIALFFPDCLVLKMKALGAVEASGTAGPETQPHTPEDSND